MTTDMSKEQMVSEILTIVDKLAEREKWLLHMAQSLSETNEQL